VFLVEGVLFISFLFALSKNVYHFACVMPLVRQVIEYCYITFMLSDSLSFGGENEVTRKLRHQFSKRRGTSCLWPVSSTAQFYCKL